MNLPSNTKITFSIDHNGYQVISLPSASGWMRYPIAAFLILWLGGWFIGLTSVSRELLTSHHKAPDIFLLFWLGGWTVGGGFAIAMLYRILRPPIPETLILSKPSLIYDSGIPTLDFMSFNYVYRRVNPWKKIFQKRRTIEFSPLAIATLKLRDVQGDNRLTIDYQNERIDLGQSLTEVEREWLFSQLKIEYRF